MAELRNSVDRTDGQGTAVAGRPVDRHAEAHEHGHDHEQGHHHGHVHPGEPAQGHGHRVGAAASVAAPRVRHSMFLASALERLMISVVLVGLIWAGILWAIA